MTVGLFAFAVGAAPVCAWPQVGMSSAAQINETRKSGDCINTSLNERKELYTPALEYRPNIRVPAGV
jgi:hypothetical protein